MLDIETIRHKSLREVFGKEDKGFTPWLANNLDRLSVAIGVPIVGASARTEVTLETLRPDIIAYTEQDDGEEVIIENQFDKSDSYHIGKLLTYAAYEKRARYAILITENARTEHIEAVKALNDKQVCGCNFLLVNAKCYQIGNSPIAIDFDVVVGLNETVRKEASEWQITLSKFWKIFSKRAEVLGVKMYSKRSNNIDNWLSGFIGNSNANFVARITKSGASVSFRFVSQNADTNNQNYTTFFQYKDKIEKAFGGSLTWINDTNRIRSKIEYPIKGIGGYSDVSNWQNIADAMLRAVKKLDAALSPYYDLLS